MGSYIQFKIYVRLDENEIKEIFVKESNTIKEMKEIISKIYFKIDKKYMLIYRGDELLNDDTTVYEYGIKELDTLIVKSSRKEEEFLIYFCYEDNKIGKFVTKDDKIYEVFKPLAKKLIGEDLKYVDDYWFEIRLFFKSFELNKSNNDTVGKLGIQQCDKIIAKKVTLRWG